MRVFTDGACSHNGRAHAIAGYAVWFPDVPSLSHSTRIPASDPQTNQRAELAAIHRAIVILDSHGYRDEDIVVYTDSEYSMNCLTKWISGWVSRGWKTAAGSDVLHRDLIEATATLLTTFKSHRFVHVRAHTGKEDDLSRQNDVVDRMARATIDTSVRVDIPAESVDELFPGCPLRLLGPPTPHTEVVAWVRANLDALPADVVSRHLIKAFAEACKDRRVTLTKQTLHKTPMLRAERMSLQVQHAGDSTVE